MCTRPSSLPISEVSWSAFWLFSRRTASGAQLRSFYATGARDSLGRAAEPSLKVLPISVWSLSKHSALPPSPTPGDVGSDHFGAEGGEDSLLTNAELAAGAVSSILWDSDLKKADALRIEEALAPSLQGAVSVCPSTFSCPSYRCVNVIYKLHLVPWQMVTYMKSLERRASLTEGSTKATKAYKAKVASLSSERAKLRARIQSLTEDLVKHKSDLKHTSTAKARVEDREKKAREGLTVAKDELRVVKEGLQASKEELCTQATALDRARQEALEAESSVERLTKECNALRGDLQRQEALVCQRDGVIAELRDEACTSWASVWLAFQRRACDALNSV